MLKLLRGFMIVSLSLLGCAHNIVLYEETFDYMNGPLPKDWWSEGNSASIHNKHLYVDANEKEYRCSTVWLNRVF